MKLSSVLLGASLVAPSVFAHPLDLPFKVTRDDFERARRSPGVIDVTGVKGATYPRLEIRQMQSEQPNQYTLLVLAMQQFTARPQNESTSFYQIAGIHGVPRVNWNGVGPCNGCSSADGYCTHDIMLFPCWHRTYMALFEQELISIATSIANSWPNSGAATTRSEMQKAASTMRMVYWDWAGIPPDNGPDFPEAFSNYSITINGPQGTETILNPLHSYAFTDSSELVYTPFTSWDKTLRYPTSDTSSALSVNADAISAFNNIRGSLQDQVYNLLTACNNYLDFSNDAAGNSSSCANSIEGIHNTIHTTTGGSPTTSVPTVGHMYYLSEAAFDPIFFAHHAMVDRLFAMWQTLNPNSYGASQVMKHGTWTIESGSTEDTTSPLTPFYQTSGQFHTCATVKDWTTFHYTYPEFVDSSGSQSAIASYVNKLYGPQATATVGSSKRSIETPAAAAAPAAKRGLFSLPKGALATNGSAYQYIANINTPRYALPGSYVIYLFLGSPASENPASWMTDKNLVGPMGVLAGENMQGADIPITGSIPLTRALTAKLGSSALAELTEELVGPFLQNLLEWRIAGPDGNAVSPSSLPGFLVSVFATTASNPESTDLLPRYSEFVPLVAATHGKSGGLSSLVGSVVGGVLGDLGL